MAKATGKARKISLRAVEIVVAGVATPVGFSYTKQLCEIVAAGAKTATDIIKSIEIMDRLEAAGDGADVLLDEATWEAIKRAINGLAMQVGLIPPLARAYGEMFSAVLAAEAVEITEAPAASASA